MSESDSFGPFKDMKISLELVKTLVESGYDIKYDDNILLRKLVEQKEYESILYLLENGIDITDNYYLIVTECPQEDTPEEYYKKVIDLFVQVPNREKQNFVSYFHILVSRCIRSNRFDILKYIDSVHSLNGSKHDGWMATCICYDRKDILKWLVEEKKNKILFSSIQYAYYECKYEDLEYLTISLKKYPELNPGHKPYDSDSDSDY